VTAEARTSRARLRDVRSFRHSIRQIPSSVWKAPLGGMSTSVSCSPLLALAQTTRTPFVFQQEPKAIRPHIMLRTTTRYASIGAPRRTAQRNSSRFVPCSVSMPLESALMFCRSVGIVARGKPATLNRTMPGIVQHLSQCLPLAPRWKAVLLKNVERSGTKSPSLSLTIRVHQWEPSSMQWTIMALERALKL